MEYDMSIVTWNMQGGTNTTESKWVTFVQQLVKKYDYVCLQEAGLLPQTSVVQAVAPAWAGVAPPPGFLWDYATWNIGTAGRPSIVHILWGNSDPNGNRVNLAICSLTAPGALLYAAPGLPGGRPGLGMQFGPVPLHVYTLHAFATGGGDAAGLVTNIGLGPAPWFALGDFNREPVTWMPPVGVLCPPNGPTRGARELDYMVKSVGGLQFGNVQQVGAWSDHLYVAY